VGFRDYYRQFDDIDEAKLNLERRERRRREKAAALERAPDIDLSGTEWPDLPHSEIVNAAIARARGFVQRYPDRHATTTRRLLADRHRLAPEQIALGNGAAELLQSAALALLSEGDELVMPWPSYPLYPLMAAHAGATPVPVEGGPIL
jgi:histidinol-phosphate aminotransferase